MKFHTEGHSRFSGQLNVDGWTYPWDGEEMECNFQEQEGDGRTKFWWIFGRQFVRMGGGWCYLRKMSKADLSIGGVAAVGSASTELSMRQEQGGNKRFAWMLYRGSELAARSYTLNYNLIINCTPNITPCKSYAYFYNSIHIHALMNNLIISTKICTGIKIQIWYSRDHASW